jgi:hypothetical protein
VAGRALPILVLVGVALAPGSAVSAPVPTTAAYQATSQVTGALVFRLPLSATHVAVYWKGSSSARVSLAFSIGGRFGRERLVTRDDSGFGRRPGVTYGAIMLAYGARAVRVTTNRSLPRLTVLALTDRGPPLLSRPALRSLSAVAQPVVIPRSGWGAEESLRFDATGKEIWPSAFWPIQKVIVHHTATQNNDPNPAATVRSIYYYDAVTQGWGDMGYNFLIDEAGNVYEGRYSRAYAPGESPTGEDLNGNGVTGAHAQGYNSGTVGIALLGTLTNQDATPAARSSLEHLIAWIEGTHGIDPQGASLYTNPVSGLQATFPNIAGHRDVAATECPGGTFYATLPQLRSDVASLISSTQPDFSVAATPASASTSAGGSVSYSVSVDATNGFSGSVGLALSGLPAGATASFTPSSVAAPGSSQLTVVSSSTTAPGTYPLTITGSSGTGSHSTSVTFVVNPPPDFGLSLNPSSKTVRRGSSTSYTVNVSSHGGFGGGVSLSIARLPAGTTANFTPSLLVPSQSSTLTIRTSSSTPRGTYTLTVTGTSGSLSHTTDATLTVRST